MKKIFILFVIVFFVWGIAACEQKEPVVKDDILPVIQFTGELETVIYAQENYDLMDGVTGFDNIDGVITDKITITSDFDSKIQGTYQVVYRLKDSSGNQAIKLERTITVFDRNGVKLVAHRGGKFGYVENTLGAFQKAADMGYYGIECDIQETKDGVLVVCHDTKPTLAGVNTYIKDMTWDELKDLTLTKTENGVTLTGKMCLFSEYLDVIKNSNSVGFIELKEGTTQKIVDDAYAMIQEKGLSYNQYKIIANTNSFAMLEYLRKKSRDIKLQFVARTDYEVYISRCLKSTIDLDISSDCFAGENYDKAMGYLNQFHEELLEVNIWVLNKETDLQKFILMGADYVTTDSLLPTVE